MKPIKPIKRNIPSKTPTPENENMEFLKKHFSVMTGSAARSPTEVSDNGEYFESFEKYFAEQSPSISSKALLNMFYNIRLEDYFAYLADTGLFTTSYLNFTLRYLKSMSVYFKKIDRNNLTVGTILTLAQHIYFKWKIDGITDDEDREESKILSDNAIMNKTIIGLILKPLNTFDERTKQYE